MDISDSEDNSSWAFMLTPTNNPIYLSSDGEEMDDRVMDHADMDDEEVDDEEMADEEMADGNYELDSEFHDMTLASCKTPTVTFLDLPEHVKIRILEYAGLLRGCFINVSYEYTRTHGKIGESCLIFSPNWFRSSRSDWRVYTQFRCFHPMVPTELFQLSRATREEIGSLFFQRNQFCAVLNSQSSLRKFTSLLGWGFHWLKDLHVDLGSKDGRFLKNSYGTVKTVLRTWARFCSQADKMTSLRSFSLRCKVKDRQVAEAIVSKMDKFPLLSFCAIHFLAEPDDGIRSVAETAVRKLTGRQTQGDTPFPWSRLPYEIKAMILDLLLCDRSDPYIRVPEWKPGLVTFQNRSSLRLTGPTCCETCSALPAMCFCHPRQTCYSSSCSCFTSPVSYFLVNKEFSDLARHVFFSGNNFAIIEDDPEPVMRFMNKIPTSSFMMIRRLTFKFPFLFRTWAKGGRAANECEFVQSWAVMIRFIREHFSLPQLTVYIVDLHERKHLSLYQKKSYTSFARRLLQQFEDLGGVREFLVSLKEDPGFEHKIELAVMGEKAFRVRTKQPLPFCPDENQAPRFKPQNFCKF